ncbi:MAG: TonB-dependent receptor plug domain-containing protein [Gemmatimonadetes bacterium]|nr:TonB-dependent receptor plug domain-containing protein [Gemmatimonadota bacterium]
MRIMRVLAVIMAVAPGPLFGQTSLLVGRIVDSATGKPVVPGSISILGTAISAMLREDGSFALSIPVREITASIRAEGYKAKEVSLRPTDDVVVIRLARDYFEQETEVVSGQATGVERKNAATTVARVGAEDLTRTPAQNMEQAVSGRVTGATISQSHAPGAAIRMQLRGMTTILGNTTPLYIVDGVTVYSIDGINPNDIESLQILKGASAGAMYGSRASNGVVIITTKRGGNSNQKR